MEHCRYCGYFYDAEKFCFMYFNFIEEAVKECLTIQNIEKERRKTMDYDQFLNIIKIALTFIIVTQDVHITACKNIDGGFTIRLLIYALKRVIVVPREFIMISTPLELFNFILSNLKKIAGEVNMHEPTINMVQTWFADKYFTR